MLNFLSTSNKKNVVGAILNNTKRLRTLMQRFDFHKNVFTNARVT